MMPLLSLVNKIMTMDVLIGKQPIMITLDLDPFLFDTLHRVQDAGFSVVEINTDDPSILGQVINDFPRLRIGAGNIISTQQLEACYKAKVDFITSPGLLPTLLQTAAVYSINYLPGVFTLSEAMQANAMGAQQVRPFPADLSFCARLSKSMPLLRLFPAEIEWEEVDHYLNLPSVSAVSMLNPDNLHGPVDGVVR